MSAWDSAVVDAQEYLRAQREANERRERLTAEGGPVPDADRYVVLYRSPARGNMMVMRAPGGKLRIRWDRALRGRLVPDGDGTFLALWETRSPDRITFDLPPGPSPARALSFGGFAVSRVEPHLPGG